MTNDTETAGPADVAASVLAGAAALACLTGVRHRWLLLRPRTVVPLIGFGPVTVTVDGGPVSQRGTVG